MKAISIHFKVRLGYDALEAYRILWDLIRGPLVKRSQYIVIDRHHLAYLNSIEKLNCMYCGYGNGLMSYIREIIARTEQYWCPIKHAKKVLDSNSFTNNYVDYGDAEAYRKQLDALRKSLSQLS